MTARIRRARGEDHAALVELWLHLVDYHRQLAPDFPVLPGIREVIAGEVRRGAQRDSCRLFVVEERGQLVGFLFAEIETPTTPSTEPPPAWIHELWLEPEARGRGLGAELLAEADAFFASRGVRRLSVRVETANGAGLEFWSRHGFLERARILERGT